MAYFHVNLKNKLETSSWKNNKRTGAGKVVLKALAIQHILLTIIVVTLVFTRKWIKINKLLKSLIWHSNLLVRITHYPDFTDKTVSTVGGTQYSTESDLLSEITNNSNLSSQIVRIPPAQSLIEYCKVRTVLLNYCFSMSTTMVRDARREDMSTVMAMIVVRDIIRFCVILLIKTWHNLA